MNILPNRLLGVVGEHEDFPVENLSKSHCNTYLASCSHDQKIKFWNIEDIPSIKVDANQKAKKAKNKVLGAAVAKDDFFADMVEGTEDQNTNNNDDDDDSDDDSSDDDASSDDDSKANEGNNIDDDVDGDSGLDDDSDNDDDDINDDSLNNDNIGDESSDGDDHGSNDEDEEEAQNG